MRLSKWSIPTTELLLISPALLFMTALFVRNLQPTDFEPAHTAQMIVNWYAARPRIGLWLLLMAMPFTVLVTGVAVLLRRWTSRAELRQAAQEATRILRTHAGTAVIAAATAAAGMVLAIVALHVITD